MTRMSIFHIALALSLLSITVNCSLFPTLPTEFSPPIFEEEASSTRLLWSKEVIGFNRSFYQTLTGTWNAVALDPNSSANVLL